MYGAPTGPQPQQQAEGASQAGKLRETMRPAPMPTGGLQGLAGGLAGVAGGAAPAPAPTGAGAAPRPVMGSDAMNDAWAAGAANQQDPSKLPRPMPMPI